MKFKEFLTEGPIPRKDDLVVSPFAGRELKS